MNQILLRYISNDHKNTAKVANARQINLRYFRTRIVYYLALRKSWDPLSEIRLLRKIFSKFFRKAG